MNKKSIFITGTGTDVGKTFVSALIVKELARQNLSVGYYKPVLSGALKINRNLHAGDCEYVINKSGLSQNPLESASYIFEDAVSPHLAAKNAGVKIDKNIILKDFQSYKKDFIVVEGAGGITCPLELDAETYLMSDLIKDLALNVVVVADAGLGVINAVLLTLEYAKNHGINVRGVILNKYVKNSSMYLDNLKTIEKLGNTKVIGLVEINAQNVEWLISDIKEIFN